MKKTAIIIACTVSLICIMNNPCKAQEPQETNKTQFGVKGGVNFSNLYTKDAENSQMLAGFNVG
jgi:hypothetical protein